MGIVNFDDDVILVYPVGFIHDKAEVVAAVDKVKTNFNPRENSYTGKKLL